MAVFSPMPGQPEYCRRHRHETQNVDDLFGPFDAILARYLTHTAHLEVATEERFVYKDVGRDQLAVVFVGGHHVGVEAGLFGLLGQRAYYVVGLVARHLDDGYAVGAYDFLDDGHRLAYDFGRLFALGLVLLVGLVPEGGAGRVEAHGDVRGVLLAQYLFEGVDKAEDGRGVDSLGVDARVFDEAVVGSVDECVGVEQKKTFVGHGQAGKSVSAAETLLSPEIFPR